MLEVDLRDLREIRVERLVGDLTDERYRVSYTGFYYIDER